MWIIRYSVAMNCGNNKYNIVNVAAVGYHSTRGEPVLNVVCHLPCPARIRIVIIILCILTIRDAFGHGRCPNTPIAFRLEKPEWRDAATLCYHPFLTSRRTGSRLRYNTCGCISRNDSMFKMGKSWCNIFYPAFVITLIVYAGTIITYLKSTTENYNAHTTIVCI